MTEPNRRAPICERCKQHEATHTYHGCAPPQTVCLACFDRLDIQHALESRMGQISDLWLGGNEDAALAALTEIFEANRHRDHDLWLSRSIASYRAMILLDAERLQEAEKACEEWERLGFADVWQRWEHASLKADILREMGRKEEALQVLETALQERDPKHLSIEISYIASLAEICAELGRTVDEVWVRRAKEVAECYGVGYPEESTAAAAILRLREITQEMLPKDLAMEGQRAP